MVRLSATAIYGWLLRGYPRAVLHNGIGRYVCQLQRLTLFFCKTSSDSSGVRNFISEDLVTFAKANPGVAIYVQPRRFKPPFVVGDYLNGRSARIGLSRCSRLEVNKWINYLRTKSGFPIVRFETPQHTDSPSIQGIWSPFTNLPTAFNVTNFPDEEAGKFETNQLSATEIVLNMAKECQKQDVQNVAVGKEGMK